MLRTVGVVWTLCLFAAPAAAGPFSWLNVTGWWKPQATRTATPSRPPTIAATATPTPTVFTETTAPIVVPPVAEGTPRDAVRVSAHAAPARVTHATLFATAGGWAVTWLVHTGDPWDPAIPSELWYAHVGTPEVPAMRLVEIHRIDRQPLYIPAISPDGQQIAVIVNELTNWKSLSKTNNKSRTTHQWFGRLNLDGTWALPLQKNKPIETRLGVHGGVGNMVWTENVVRVTTEATCSNAKHQCTYSQRINPATGSVTGRGSITISNMGHQTAPQIVAFDSKTSWLVTVSDGAKQYGGLMLRRDFLGGWPIPLSSPFLLDYDPRAAWNGDPGVGKRVGVLWRQVRTNDDRLNAAGEPWRMRFVTFDVLNGKLLVLSDTQVSDWSTKPGYEYGYPRFSRWNTALEHLSGGGWIVGFQMDGDYVVGQLSETGVLLWRSAVSPAIDYAGDVAVRADRIGYVTTRHTADGGVELVLGER